MEQTVMKMLETVKDPEIDSISIVDLGMVHSIEMRREGCTIKLLPTFAGCPALDIIKGNVEKGVHVATGNKRSRSTLRLYTTLDIGPPHTKWKGEAERIRHRPASRDIYEPGRVGDPLSILRFPLHVNGESIRTDSVQKHPVLQGVPEPI